MAENEPERPTMACERCRATIERRHPRQRYCAECAFIRRRASVAARERRYRRSKGAAALARVYEAKEQA